MDTKEIFANRLLEIRELKGITRQKMADDLEISRASLEYYEKGKRTPDLNTINRISDYLGVSVDYLFGKTKCISPNEDLQTVCKFFDTDVNMVLGIKRLITKNEKYDYELRKVIFSSYFQEFLLHIFYSWTLRKELGYKYLDELKNVSKYIDKDGKELYKLFDVEGYDADYYEKEITRLTKEIELNEYKSQKLLLTNLLNCNSKEYNHTDYSYEQYLYEYETVPTEKFYCSIENDINYAKSEIKDKIQEYIDNNAENIQGGENNADNTQT